MRAVVELARTCTEEAVATLREIALDKTTNAMARVRACEALLQRGWGVPMPDTRIDSLFADETTPIVFRLALGREPETVEDGEWTDAGQHSRPS